VLTTSSPLLSRLWRLNKGLDRSPHTDQSNYRLLDRRTAPVSTGIIGIHLLGDYMISNFELNGPMKGFQDVIARKIAKRYDIIALVSFFSFLVVAYRSYKKDRKRFW
jgi:hypothetical protein